MTTPKRKVFKQGSSLCLSIPKDTFPLGTELNVSFENGRLTYSESPLGNEHPSRESRSPQPSLEATEPEPENTEFPEEKQDAEKPEKETFESPEPKGSEENPWKSDLPIGSSIFEKLGERIGQAVMFGYGQLNKPKPKPEQEELSII
ncbi:hypothetical protein MUO83_09920 [Candidatus Bathyarchaeota archaeon]|nr:hypothetical protein [Candidatus Bathyarchaeota archaeon]